LGARKLRRAFQAGLVAVGQCGSLAAVVATTFFFGADSIYSFMHRDPLVGEVGVPALRMLAAFQIPLVVFLVLRFSLQGAGDTRFPMLTTFLGIAVCRVPAAWVGGVVLKYGLIGAWSGMMIDIGFRSLMISFRYLRRKWLTTRI
jgi:Na+-driven multidrug efflux pump